MENRNQIIRSWFDMWLQKKDTGILDIFSKEAVYIENWGPEYHGAEAIKQWFDEWNTRGTVLKWEIKQCIHDGEQTIVEWYFKNTVNNDKVEEFDGISLIRWTADNKIYFLKEFGCNIHHYNPYENGTVPQFRDEPSIWF